MRTHATVERLCQLTRQMILPEVAPLQRTSTDCGTFIRLHWEKRRRQPMPLLRRGRFWGMESTPCRSAAAAAMRRAAWAGTAVPPTFLCNWQMFRRTKATKLGDWLSYFQRSSSGSIDRRRPDAIAAGRNGFAPSGQRLHPRNAILAPGSLPRDGCPAMPSIIIERLPR